jgi:hypothetical protein
LLCSHPSVTAFEIFADGQLPVRALPDAKALKRSAEHIAQTRQLLDVDVVARDDLGLQGLDLDSHGRRLPDKDLAGLAQPVLPAKVISERDGYVTIAARDHAAAVDATKEERIVGYSRAHG